MKKITFLLSFILCAVLANAQTNLLTNPGFETWTNGTAPDSWTLGTTGTVTKSTTTPSSTGNALQIAATGTFSTTQIVPAPSGGFDATKNYKVSFKYKVVSGDGTDARLWCNWITSAVGATTTTYNKMTLTDSLALKGPGGNVQPASGTSGTGSNGYLIDNRSTDWQTYSYSFSVPTGVTQFSFQLRTYNGATVIWDEAYFGVDSNTGLNNINQDNFKISISNNLLSISNAPSTTVEIFNTVGAKVKSLVLVNNQADLNLAKGIYIVRCGNATGKIML